jgi:hypothetical protein
MNSFIFEKITEEFLNLDKSEVHEFTVFLPALNRVLEVSRISEILGLTVRVGTVTKPEHENIMHNIWKWRRLTRAAEDIRMI